MISPHLIQRHLSKTSKLPKPRWRQRLGLLIHSSLALPYCNAGPNLALRNKVKYSFSTNVLGEGKSFDEARLIHDYLHLTSGCGHEHSASEITTLFAKLKDNIQRIENPQSLIALVDKKGFFEKKYWSEELELGLMERVITLFSQEKNWPGHDKGAMLRSIILVSCLSKIGLKLSRSNEPKGQGYYASLLSLAMSSLKELSFPSALTISESLIYNRQFFKQLSHGQLMQLFSKLNEITGSSVEIKMLPKVIALMIYLDKFPREDQEHVELRGAFRTILTTIYDLAFKIITQRNDTSSDDWVLFITELFNSLEIVQQTISDKQVLYMHNKFEGVLNNYYEKSLGKKEQLEQHALVSFLKKFHNQPPIKLNPKVLKLIQNSFAKMNLEQSLQEINFYLYFLAKVLREGFKISETTNRKILEKVPQEKNIYTLAKTLEVYAAVNLPTRKNLRKMSEAEKSFQKEKIELNEKILSAIEERIFHLAGKSLKPHSALIGVFQSFAALDFGEHITWLYLFNYFSKPETLAQLDFVELYIKLLPAASIKTRNTCKLFTNISQNMKTVGGNLGSPSGESSNPSIGSGPIQIDPKLKDQMEAFWTALEEYITQRANEVHFDKYSIILFHFVYANMLGRPLKKVYQAFAPKIEKHCDKLSLKQLSEITYAYARIGERPYALLKTIQQNLHKRDPKHFERAAITETINLFWGFTMSGFYYEDLAKKCIAFAEKQSLTPESLSQLLQALGHLGNFMKNSEAKVLVEKAVGMILSEKSEPNYVFSVAYSLMLNRCFSNVDWEGILASLLRRRNQWEKNQLYLYYFYLLFTHVKFLGKAQLSSSGLSEQFIIEHRSAILSYFLIEKKKKSSNFEKRLIDVLESFGAKKCTVQKFGAILLIPQEASTLEGFELSSAEHLISPYIVDYQSDQFSLEVNGPHHYLQDPEGNYLMDGASSLKRDFLKSVGVKVVDVPFFEYREGWTLKEKQEYLKKKLLDEGVVLA